MSSANHIDLLNLSLIFFPLIVTIIIYTRWVKDWITPFYAAGRMLGQLFLIGFLLKFIFDASSPLISSAVL